MKNVEEEKTIYRPDTKEEAASLTNQQLADTLEDEIRLMKFTGSSDVSLLAFKEIVKRLRKRHVHPQDSEYFRGEPQPSMADGCGGTHNRW